MIAMTDAQRARVHPFRGDPVTLPVGDDRMRQLHAWWNEADRGSSRRDWWTRGIPHAAAPLDTRMTAAIDLLDGGARPATDPDVEATLMWMLDHWSRRDIMIVGAGATANARYAPVDAWFVRRWLAAGGIPFALRVLDAFPRYEADMSRSGAPDVHTLSVKARDGYSWWCLEVGHLGLIHMLRKAIVASGDSEYAVGVAAATQIRETAPLFLRAAIAFAFPDEPFWQADLRDATPKPKAKAKPPARLGTESWGLVTTRVDEAAIPAILDSMARDGQPWTTATEDYGFTLVHRLGDGAAPHLLGYLGVVRDRSAKQAFAEALALTETPETRAFFASKAKDKTLGPTAKAYLAR